jgi:hypothetical protein
MYLKNLNEVQVERPPPPAHLQNLLYTLFFAKDFDSGSAICHHCDWTSPSPPPPRGYFSDNLFSSLVTKHEGDVGRGG